MDEAVSSRRLWDGLSIAAIGVGSTLRIAGFWQRGPFWGDEAALAANLLTRSYSQLTQPLDLWQAAPVGFLLLEKWLASRLGMEESILRLPSLLAGIATLIIGAWSFRSLLGPTVAAVATILLAFAPDLIRYSSEFKPYAFDAAIATGLFALCFRRPRSDRPRDLGVLACAGVVAPWFSFPAVFVLAGCGSCLIFSAAIEGHRRLAVLLSLIATLWVGSFAIEYLLCLRTAATEPELLRYWSTAFAPLPPGSLADLKWYGAKAVYLFEPTVGLGARHLALAVFVAGCGLLLRRDRLLVASIGATVAAVLAASAIRKYPFTGRLLLFLIPILIGPIAVCFEALFAPLQRWRRRRAMVGLGLIGLLLVQPIHSAATRLATDWSRADTKARNASLYQAMIANYRVGDRFVVGPEANWVFQYYARRHGFEPPALVYLTPGPNLRAEWARQLAEPGAARIWLFDSLSQAKIRASEAQRPTDDRPATVRMTFNRSDEILGFALRRYEPPR